MRNSKTFLLLLVFSLAFTYLAAAQTTKFRNEVADALSKSGFIDSNSIERFFKISSYKRILMFSITLKIGRTGDIDGIEFSNNNSLIDTTFSKDAFKNYMIKQKKLKFIDFKDSYLVVPVLIRDMRGGDITIAQNFEFLNDFRDLIPTRLTDKKMSKNVQLVQSIIISMTDNLHKRR